MITLDDHQMKAVTRLDNGKVLCGGVGSGKSRTALAYYYTKVCGGTFPHNGKGRWSPFTRFRKLYIITTAQKRDKLEWMDECADFNLNPDDVVIDSWNNIKKYLNVCGAFFIFDEQRLTGSGAWVKAFYQIVKKNKWILLTATPGDSWIEYVPLFVAHGFYKNKTEFCRRHVIYSRYANYPKITGYYDTDILVYYKNLIVIKMNYIKKTERKEQYIYCSYDSKLYDTIFKDRWNPYKDEPIQNISGVCHLLRKAVNSHESRIEALKDMIIAHPKMIIFYNFDFELDILRQAGKELDVTIAEWNGHKHMPIPKTDRWIYLVHYLSGAEGWNCIETDTILFYSDSYSYKQMEQAKGRIDRRNTPFATLYYIHLTSSSRIDRSIRACLSRKENFNENNFIEESEGRFKAAC